MAKNDGLKIKFIGFDGKEKDVGSLNFNRKIKRDNIKKNILTALAKESSKQLNKAARDAIVKSKKAAAQRAASNIASPFNNNKASRTINSGINKDLLPKTAEAGYRLLAQLFLRLVARTPVDEEYYYTYTRYLGDKFFRYIAKHTLTDRKYGIKPYARDDWKLNVVFENNSSFLYTTETLKNLGCNLDNEHDSKSITAITNLFKKDGKGSFLSKFNFENMNEHFKYFEFGYYNSSGYLASEQDDYQHKGAKYSHGSRGGYSVQAPRGVIGLTVAEFDKAKIMAESNNTRVYARNRGRIGSFSINKTLGNEDNPIKKFLDSKQDKKDVFTEREILQSFLSNKPVLEFDITNPEDDRKVNEYNNKVDADYIKTYNAFKAKVREIEKEIKGVPGRPKGSNDKQKRKSRDVNGMIRTKFTERIINWTLENDPDNLNESFVFTFYYGPTEKDSVDVDARIHNGEIQFNSDLSGNMSSKNWGSAENFIRNFTEQIFGKRKRDAELMKKLYKDIESSINDTEV